MLQARLFSYGDAQRYRLGVNFNHIPVNAPKCPLHTYHRDGAMRTDGNMGRTPTYFPNSWDEWIDQPDLNEPPLQIAGAAAHWDHRVDDDHYQQPGDLFRKMNAIQRQILFDNTARSVGGAAVHIQERHVANCTKADPEYGAGVAAALRRMRSPLDGRLRGPKTQRLGLNAVDFGSCRFAAAKLDIISESKELGRERVSIFRA